MANKARPTTKSTPRLGTPQPAATTSAAKQSKPQPSKSQSSSSARARLAAERVRQERRRRRMFLVAIPVAVVLVAVGALIVVRLAGGASAGSTSSSGPASDAVITGVTSVPAAVLDQVGTGSVTSLPQPANAPPLTDGGKPKVLYVGAEYCPYCAAERWAVVVALSRFGTFSGLGQTASAAKDVYPSTPTLTFHGASFTSKTIAFTGVETQSNQIAGGDYAPLDTLSAADQQTFSTYNQPPYVSTSGSIPFLDIGGKYLISGASYSPQLLAGKTHEQVATALADPSSDIAKAADGTANVITAAICKSTNNSPAAVCSSAGVQAAAKQLG
jgi:thiol-disulfide isomerase/thioredoxin